MTETLYHRLGAHASPTHPPHRRSSLRAALLLSMTLSSSATIGRAQTASRHFVDAAWELSWTISPGIGRPIEDPVELVADPSRVYVLDAGGRRIVALQAHTGMIEWSFGDALINGARMGKPSSLVLLRSDTLVVADPTNSRLLYLTPRGQFVRATPEPSPTVHSMCVLHDRSVLIGVLSPDAPVLHISSAGDILQILHTPWRGLTSPGQVQGVIAALPSGDRCVYAMQAGQGFTLMSPTGFARPWTYIEPASTSPDASPLTATSVQATDATLAVAYRGNSRDFLRIVDLYDARTGRYLRSIRIPDRIVSLFRVGRSLYGIQPHSGRSRIVAWHDATGASASYWP